MDSAKVKFVGMKSSRPLVRYVERQVGKWIDRERTLLFRPDDTDFHVEIERDPDRLGYECELWVRIGARQWASHEEGRTLHSTLESALRHLQSVIRPFSVEIDPGQGVSQPVDSCEVAS